MLQVAPAQTRLPFPTVGTAFELTAREEITGLGLVTDFQKDPNGWRTSAVSIPAGTTRRFKLFGGSLDAIARTYKAQGGRPTSGCWMKVFDETFGSDGYHCVAIPDTSWVNPYGLTVIPMVHGSGCRDFGQADDYRISGLLLLIEVEDSLAT